ncbi:hypothetical protein CDAR_34931 [Caerostris darwini]|uniref:Uncharacterized protein n=1 Tax=Caerostris darwini TaxID=1538125 RepID=A0AAV4MRQ9_9ARAC|nr:hypothetical protein CDAR_34931 [Caerostris darwini]
MMAGSIAGPRFNGDELCFGHLIAVFLHAWEKEISLDLIYQQKSEDVFRSNITRKYLSPTTSRRGISLALSSRPDMKKRAMQANLLLTPPFSNWFPPKCFAED